MIKHILPVNNCRPEELIQYIPGKVKASRKDIKGTLLWNITNHYIFTIRTIFGNILKTEIKISETDEQIDAILLPSKLEKAL
jgi:hypothetical protein